ncbi:hypothetical protein [Microbulbifer sp. S227A]|uniref:hypothetical protein n=1 Tax=Microbulbifer sp. S227A TaxID=3415131 RepID=UPI003C7DC379
MNMNVTNTDKDIEATQAPAPQRSATLNEADIAMLHKTLGQGLAGFARQGDIVELHKRIGEKFEKLPGELNALDKETRDTLLARVEALETGLNSLEAALRIELPPLLTRTIDEAAREAIPRRRGGILKFFFLLFVAGGGVAIGAFYHAPIMEFAARLPGYLSY